MRKRSRARALTGGIESREEEGTGAVASRRTNENLFEKFRFGEKPLLSGAVSLCLQWPRGTRGLATRARTSSTGNAGKSHCSTV